MEGARGSLARSVRYADTVYHISLYQCGRVTQPTMCDYRLVQSLTLLRRELFGVSQSRGTATRDECEDLAPVKVERSKDRTDAHRPCERPAPRFVYADEKLTGYE